MKKKDVTSIKKENVFSIFKAIVDIQPAIKKDITSHTELSYATVSNICNELIKSGIIEKTKDKSPTNVGRIPFYLRVSEKKYSLSFFEIKVENGITSVNCKLLSMSCKIIAQEKVEFNPPETQVKRVVERCFRIFRKITEEIKLNEIKNLGIGGIIKYDPNFMNEKNLYKLKEEFEVEVKRRFKLPIIVKKQSDFDSYFHQIKDGEDNLIYLRLGKILECSVISDGVRICSEGGLGVNASYLPIGSGKKVRADGFDFVAENDLTEDGLVSLYRGLSNKNIKTYSELQNISSSDVFLKKSMEIASYTLAKLISILIDMLNISKVYIGGTLSKEFIKYANFIRENCENMIKTNRKQEFSINFATKNKEAVLQGFFFSVMKEWFENYNF